MPMPSKLSPLSRISIFKEPQPEGVPSDVLRHLVQTVKTHHRQIQKMRALKQDDPAVHQAHDELSEFLRVCEETISPNLKSFSSTEQMPSEQEEQPNAHSLSR